MRRIPTRRSLGSIIQQNDPNFEGLGDLTIIGGPTSNPASVPSQSSPKPPLPSLTPLDPHIVQASIWEEFARGFVRRASTAPEGDVVPYDAVGLERCKARLLRAWPSLPLMRKRYGYDSKEKLSLSWVEKNAGHKGMIAELNSMVIPGALDPAHFGKSRSEAVMDTRLKYAALAGAGIVGLLVLRKLVS